jgi:hypothetical protein
MQRVATINTELKQESAAAKEGAGYCQRPPRPDLLS